jgi:NADPH:quinone reductase-like Zn-dependent oxidoreductase
LKTWEIIHKMKAIVWTNYGSPDVLQLKEVATPSPKVDEVLVRVHATTVLIGDCELRNLKMPMVYRLPMRIFLGFSKPKRVTILGQELAGEITTVGDQITRFKSGDAVIAATLLRLGTYAEYVCLPESYLAVKPSNLTYEEATTIPTGGIYGLHLLRESSIKAGQKLLIIGAGGSIGTYATQIAKLWGAEVTCVDSTKKLDMLRSIGADQVIDYTQGDYTRSGKTYDAIIDVVGKGSFSGYIKLLKPMGVFVLGNPSASSLIRGRWTSMRTDKKVVSETAVHTAEAYAYLTRLIEAGKIKPVIDRTYPLEQTAEAHRYVDSGQKKGNVVITVGHTTAS